MHEQLPLFDQEYEEMLWRAYFQGFTRAPFSPMWTVKCSLDEQEQWYVSGAVDLKELQGKLQASAKRPVVAAAPPPA